TADTWCGTRSANISRLSSDGGMIHEFDIVIEESRLMFADRVPHHVAAVAARKVLTPTAHGYEETLQLDRGLGVFEPYYSIPIQRRECAVSAPCPKSVSALASARYICSCLPHCAFETQTHS